MNKLMNENGKEKIIGVINLKSSSTLRILMLLIFLVVFSLSLSTHNCLPSSFSSLNWYFAEKRKR